MRRSPLIVLGLLLITASLSAAAESDGSDLPRPKAGASLRLLQKQTKTKPTPQGPMTIVVETPVEVTVVSADAGGAIIRWKRGEAKITDIDLAALHGRPDMKPAFMQMVTAQAGPLISSMDNMTLVLKFDADMAFEGLQNTDDLVAASARSLDALNRVRRQFGNPPMDKKEWDKIVNRKVLEQVGPKEALIYLAPGGIKARRGATVTTDTASPNPIGGPPIQSTVTATLDANPDDKGLLVLHTATAVDSAKFAESMKQALATAQGAKPLSPDAERAMAGMQLSVTADYHLDPATGLSAEATNKTLATIGKDANTDAYSWTVATDAR